MEGNELSRTLFVQRSGTLLTNNKTNMNNKKISISFSVSVYTIIACVIIVVLLVTNVAFVRSYVRAERANKALRYERAHQALQKPSYPAILVTR